MKHSLGLLKKLINLLESYAEKPNKLSTYKNHKDLKKILNLEKESTNDISQIFEWIEKYLKYSTNTSHKNFVNRMWAGGNPTSILGEVLSAITNSSSCTFESAPVASLLEKYMIEQMLQIVGFESGAGQMTTGSSNANMIAMLMARNLFSESKNKGLFASKKLVAFASVEAHYSLDKAGNTIGIGIENIIKIPSLTDGSMDVEELENKINKEKEAGNIPFFVCATLGTTVKGGYDSIEKISELQKKYDFWLHGDGAWGGAVIFNDELKQKFLPKLDAIDSFTMDFHKMLGTNLVCNFLLTKNNLSLKNTCASGNTSYIFYDCENDLGAQSLQCAKKVDSLKWFLDWKFYGKSGFAKRVKEYYLLAQYGEKIVENNPNLELVFPVLSFNICFRFLAHNNIKEEHNNEINQKIRTTLQASNRLLISTAYIENKLVFRLLISNINTTKESLEQTIDIIVETGKEELKNTQIGHK